MNSPCNKVCVMDADNRYCLGCRRTLGEIAQWGEMTDAERDATLIQLSSRGLTSGSAAGAALLSETSAEKR